MGDTKSPKHSTHEETIAAFDRERARLHEWSRRHSEQVRTSRALDRPIYIERRRKPR
jgi:hypothetical protein